MAMQVRELIEQAVKVTGSQQALADALGVPFQRVSNWKQGHMVCTPDTRALIAQIAGLNWAKEWAEAMAEKHADSPVAERVKAMLKQSTM